jgi:hypothetical protein
MHCLRNLTNVLCKLQACVELSRNVGQLRTETELLPQCWEQVHSISSLKCSTSPGGLSLMLSLQVPPFCWPSYENLYLMFHICIMLLFVD